MMLRTEGWVERINAVTEKYMDMPFVFGKTDCFCMASEMLEACCEQDIAGHLRGTYHTWDEADAVLSANGFSSVHDIFDRHFERKNRLQCHRGAVGTFMQDGRPMLGIYTGYGFMVRTKRSLTAHPLADVDFGWDVPFEGAV